MKKILIADDNELSRKLLRESLRTHPVEILEARDGREALEMLHQTPVDLLITDRGMPRMDGLELLTQLRKENNQVKVIMLSGYEDTDFWTECYLLGADNIVKPFTMQDIVITVMMKLEEV